MFFIQKYLTWIIALVLLGVCILSSGCVCVNARLEFLEQQKTTYNQLPCKFYVVSCSLNNLSMKNQQNIKNLLELHWPQLFTRNTENAVPISYHLSVDSDGHFEGDAIPAMLLSFFSYGLLPAFDNYEKQAQMTVKIGNSSKTIYLKEIGRRSANVGVLAILGTKYLIPKVNGATFGNSLTSSSLTVYSNMEKEFLQHFVDAIYAIPRDEILHFYFSQRTQKTELLN